MLGITGNARTCKLFDAAGHMRVDWRGHVGCHLGGQRTDFLGLSRECTELLAPISRPQLHHLGEGLGFRAMGQ
jgi:hypothetical protein